MGEGVQTEEEDNEEQTGRGNVRGHGGGEGPGKSYLMDIYIMQNTIVADGGENEK